jgi:formylmethanofuran dehydrogenase subunit A
MTTEQSLSLPDAQKEAVWESLNREIPIEETHPLTPAQRKLWQQVKRRGRPKIGAGAKIISLSIERGLLDRADAYAKQHGLSRAQLVARGLEVVIGTEPTTGRRVHSGGNRKAS